MILSFDAGSGKSFHKFNSKLNNVQQDGSLCLLYAKANLTDLRAARTHPAGAEIRRIGLTITGRGLPW
jgi:hypothetical protein